MEAVRFRFSNSEDDEALLRVLEDSWMSEKDFQIGVTYKKESCLNLAAALSADRSAPTKLITFEDAALGIQGLASLAKWDDETLDKVGLKSIGPAEAGYLADLRISATANRRMKVLWRHHYRDLIESHEGQTLLTSVLDENTLARNALCDKREGIRYDPVLSYSTLTLFDPPSPESAMATQAEREELPSMLKIEYRTNFNRQWKIKTTAGIQEIDVLVITNVLGLEQLSSLGVELNLEKGVREIWNDECQNEKRVIQIAAPAHFVQLLQATFKNWRHLVTPATLYAVSAESQKRMGPRVVLEPTDRRILDVSVL